MKQIEEKMVEHISTFPDRRRELLEFQKTTLENFKEIKDQIKEGLKHQQPSSATIQMYGDLRDKVENIEHVFFGNEQTKEKGMVKKVDEMYDILTQAKGAGSLLKIITLIGGATTAIIAVKVFWNKL